MKVEFLLDTGADITSLSPNVVIDHHLDLSKLKKNTTIGIGGSVEGHMANDVKFGFMDVKGNLVQFNLDQIDIRKPNPHMRDYTNVRMTPSLLGTDMLQYFKFTYNSYPKLDTKSY